MAERLRIAASSQRAADGAGLRRLSEATEFLGFKSGPRLRTRVPLSFSRSRWFQRVSPLHRESVVVILLFFVLHWQLSIFCQTFYLHRYGAHRQFEMSKGWERFFHLLTWVTQGSSYLSPRAYAILHRMHHAYSDSPKDPHSPANHTNVLTMMWHTKNVYSALRQRDVTPESRFEGGYPEWPLLDGPLSHWSVSIAWGVVYTLFYLRFAQHPLLFALLPIHFFMGPVHGAIVNWCGHKYGYRNFENGDLSRNTLPFDFLTLGELFQNNHHKFGQSPNFAARWFEVDPCYQIMRIFSVLGIIDLKGAQSIRPPRAPRSVPRYPSLPSPIDAK